MAIFSSSKKTAPPSLWIIVDERKWDALRQLLVVEQRKEVLPDPQQCRYHAKLACRVSFLSYSIAKGAPDDIIQVILEVDEYRRSLSIPERYGRLPLHIACLCDAHITVIQVLVDSFPYAVVIQDKKGNLPLHYAVAAACRVTTLSSSPQSQQQSQENSPDQAVEIVMLLLNTAPTSIVTVNKTMDAAPDLAKRLEYQAINNTTTKYSSNDDEVKGIPSPIYTLLASISRTVMRDWNTHHRITIERTRVLHNCNTKKSSSKVYTTTINTKGMSSDVGQFRSTDHQSSSLSSLESDHDLKDNNNNQRRDSSTVLRTSSILRCLITNQLHCNVHL